MYKRTHDGTKYYWVYLVVDVFGGTSKTLHICRVGEFGEFDISRMTVAGDS